ncbi:hypothetical protein [Marinoscillum pacificum]|uniref:hypothetical protein n=1 Tax=Marinoscillum pacificum TaxID=392723 RepID=UPI002157F5EE|nr:hypothetical protein [Marinoscillum pacificum]
MKNVISIWALSLLISHFVYSQSSIEIRVLDEETNNPIAFAHVVSGRTTTISNADGYFVITPNSSTIQISHVGYEVYKLRMSRDLPDQIFLTPSVIERDNESINTGNSIMREFWNRKITNYDLNAYWTTSYYKEKLLNEDKLIYLAEGILDILKPANVNEEGVKISPIKTRKMVEGNFTLDPVYIQGNAFDMVVSSIWRENSFLSPKAVKHYEFTYEGKQSFGDKKVFIIKFEPATGKGYVSGTLYINEGDYAIIKMEYSPDSSLSEFWESVKWEEEYELNNGSYVLSSVRYNGTYHDLGDECHFESILLNNEISTKDISQFPESELQEKDIFLKEASSDFNDSFWGDFNYLKLTNSETLEGHQLSK